VLVDPLLPPELFAPVLEELLLYLVLGAGETSTKCCRILKTLKSLRAHS